MKRGPKPKTNQEWAEGLQERFFAKVAGPDTNGCWNWTGAKDMNGYGRFSTGAAGAKLAHRISMALDAGDDIDPSLSVMHHCDNPSCVSPFHLSVVPHAVNMADSAAKCRHSYGERHPVARLTDKNVREMRRAAATGEHILSIAARFNMSRRSASQAVSGETWKHIKDDA